jgi:branched-chain amino acid transport system ATP-binding protein
LSIQGISAGYGGVRALSDVTLMQGEGEIVTLIGGNGAGKTTLLNIISGIIKPKVGTISFNGEDITGLPPNRIVNLGISQVPEGRHLFNPLTVTENLELGAYRRRGVGKQVIAKDMAAVFHLFPILEKRFNQQAGTLSGGEQQMLAIGRGLMGKPLLMLLDEPTLGLAPIIVAEILKTIQRLRDFGTTILMVEQNARAALSIADRGYVIKTGTLRLTGSARDLLHNAEVKTAYLGADSWRHKADA